MNRAEHDLYKILAHKIALLRGIVHNEEAKEALNEMVAVLDGYFLEANNRTRKEDILVSLLTDEQKAEVCRKLNLNLGASDV